MAPGDLTCTEPTVVSTTAGIKVAVDLLNLAAVTDNVFVIPISGRDQSWAIFKVEREA